MFYFDFPFSWQFAYKYSVQEEPCRRKVTLNKNFLDRLASDFMTIEPQVSKRSKSHDRVRDRERSPIRKRRNSAEEHPSPRSSRSRHRSGRSSRAFGRSGGDPEPAHLDSKDAVTLVECSKINSEKIDFRNTEKNFSRYMGLCKIRIRQNRYLKNLQSLARSTTSNFSLLTSETPMCSTSMSTTIARYEFSVALKSQIRLPLLASSRSTMAQI